MTRRLQTKNLGKALVSLVCEDPDCSCDMSSRLIQSPHFKDRPQRPTVVEVWRLKDTVINHFERCIDEHRTSSAEELTADLLKVVQEF